MRNAKDLVRVYSELRPLIVEDDGLMRLLIREALEGLGFHKPNIVEAGNGLEAIDLLAQETPHFIICDWRMEPVDGLTFLRKLRDPVAGNDAFTPVILCSAHTDEQLIERARDLGVNEVTNKPIKVGNLESRIRAVIERPRPFVNDGGYFGPDRRRWTDGISQDPDRRTKKARLILPERGLRGGIKRPQEALG